MNSYKVEVNGVVAIHKSNYFTIVAHDNEEAVKKALERYVREQSNYGVVEKCYVGYTKKIEES